MRFAALLFCAAGLPLAARAQSIPLVIYSKAGGHPTATIPGALDASGAPVAAEFRAMEDLVGSTDGTQWLLKGRTQLGSDLETMLMLGSGTTGSVLIQEGQPALGGGWYDFIGSGVGRFNNDGDFAFSARVRTGATGSTSAADGHRVLRSTSGVLSLEFKQLDSYTGLSDTNPSGDETVGNSVGSIHLLDEGTIGCQDSTINNIHTSRRPAIFYDRAMFHQTGVTTIVGMGGLGNRPWSTIDANEFYTTPSGSQWIAEGQVTLPTTGTVRVLVLDGNAVLQANETVPGSSLVLGDIFQSAISAGGHWMALASRRPRSPTSTRTATSTRTTSPTSSTSSAAARTPPASTPTSTRTATSTRTTSPPSSTPSAAAAAPDAHRHGDLDAVGEVAVHPVRADHVPLAVDRVLLPAPKWKMRECSRNRPTTEMTLMFSDSPGHARAQAAEPAARSA
jgi:hypothetical protein